MQRVYFDSGSTWQRNNKYQIHPSSEDCPSTRSLEFQLIEAKDRRPYLTNDIESLHERKSRSFPESDSLEMRKSRKSVFESIEFSSSWSDVKVFEAAESG